MALDSQENARLDLKLTLTTGTAHIASVHKIIETPKSESPPFQKNNLRIIRGYSFEVCNGHGPLGKLVAFRSAQSIPKLLLEAEATDASEVRRAKRGVFLGELVTCLPKRQRGQQRTAAGAFREVCRSRAQEVC